MRTLLIAIIVLLTFLTSKAQQYFGTPVAEGHRSIVLMNPTVRNLETFIYLVDNQIFALPKDYHIVGFYQKDQQYNFQQSIDFLKSSPRSDLFLQVCQDVPGAMLFGENPCSDDFYNVFSGSIGVIFFGGPDIPPSFYGEDTGLLTEITDYPRHAFEVSFLFHLLGGFQNDTFVPYLAGNPDYKILGICLGMQTMNVATGGTLYQDIPSQLYKQQTIEQILEAETDARHRNYVINTGYHAPPMGGSFHQIKLSPAFVPAWNDYNKELTPVVLSSHHQAVKKLGKGWITIAGSMDGKVIEAIRHETYPHVIGVQFHPEPSFLYQKESKLNLFPGQLPGASFMELYGGDRGEQFNRLIWQWMGNIYR
ncbi:MAG: gamma-glutamyl-gamma-aminobutyrate hydrolase family protein [Lentimicrobiaceae bacterium]|nr:gamma-glutamyl-gamma-aminobutyrate hydrolase family protein [Lentimicrobiaceae bacterium]